MIEVPAEVPVTTPDGLMVATAVVPLVHDTPPAVASDTWVVAPEQTSSVPAMAAGGVFTFIG